MAKSSTGTKGVAAGASANNTVSFKKSVVNNTATTRQQAGASPAPQKSADMDDIFGVLSKKKKAPPTDPGASASQTGSVGSSKAGKIDSAPQVNVPPRKGDGLYRTAAASVEMADDDFFGESAGASTSKRAAKKKSSSSGATSVQKPKRSLEKEGVDRVITEDELMKLTSAKDEAGTTPNCPFDCDCCF
jgi:membrane protein involved in colicin uptake